MSKQEQVNAPQPRYAGITLRKLEQREVDQQRLEKSATGMHVWAVAFCLVMGGFFFSWNGGVVVAGFIGYLIAVLYITFGYFCFSTSLAEISAALPFSGGGYAYARITMGPWMGFVSGLAESLEWLSLISANTFSIGQLFNIVVGFSFTSNYTILWWFAFLLPLLLINLAGGKIFYNFTILVAGLVILFVMLFCVSAFFFVDSKYGNNFVPPNPTGWFHDDFTGIFKSLPFAVVFFFGIEGTPLIAEETLCPQKNLPRGILLGQLTVAVVALVIFFFNLLIPPGVQVLGFSGYPFVTGFQTLWGQSTPAAIFACMSIVGVIGSLHTSIFCFGRQVYSMARSAYVPPILSRTLFGRTPYISMITGTVIGFCFIFAIQYSSVTVQGALLNVAILTGFWGYCMLMISYIILKIRLPELERPYKAPLGIFGAINTIVFALATIISVLIYQTSARYSLIFVGGWYVIGFSYFILYSRKHLRISPEESFAMLKAYNILFQKKKRKRVIV